MGETTTPRQELHEIDPERFLEEVHTFQFWFDAVEGYLPGTEFGHAPDASEPPMDPDAKRRLISVLCNYLVGEAAALEGASGLIAIAPSRHAQVFLATQVVDEARHVEVFVRRLRDLGVTDPDAEIRRCADPSLLRFKKRLLELIRTGDWEAALFAQNVTLEAMEFAVFHQHARGADPITRAILEGVLKDERRHIGFGENELGRRLISNPGLRERLRSVRQEFDRLVLSTFENSATTLGVAAPERRELGATYLQAVQRLGVGR